MIRSSPNQRYRRLIDLAISLPLLILTAPVNALIAVCIKVTSPGPILYRSRRVGQRGETFELLKFRTMIPDAALHGAGVTHAGDPRVTRIGAFLRRWKLDELPQLWNVARAEMSIVGPRPEVPQYVHHYTDEQRSILDYRPGLISPATLAFRNEQDILDTPNPEMTYLSQILPMKIKIDSAYFRRGHPIHDVRLVVHAVVAIALPNRDSRRGTRHISVGADGGFL